MTEKRWRYTLYVGGPRHGEFNDDEPGVFEPDYPRQDPRTYFRDKPVVVLHHKSLETPEARSLALLSIEGVLPCESF